MFCCVPSSLDELSFAEHEELTEEDLEEKQQAFDRYKKLKEGVCYASVILMIVFLVVMSSLYQSFL